MTYTLLKNLSQIVSFDDKDNIYENCSILIKNNRISAIGKNISIIEDVNVIDCTGLIALRILYNQL